MGAHTMRSQRQLTRVPGCCRRVLDKHVAQRICGSDLGSGLPTGCAACVGVGARHARVQRRARRARLAVSGCSSRKPSSSARCCSSQLHMRGVCQRWGTTPEGSTSLGAPGRSLGGFARSCACIEAWGSASDALCVLDSM